MEEAGAGLVKLEQKLKNFCHSLVFYDDDDDDCRSMKTPIFGRAVHTCHASSTPLAEVGQINIKFGEKFSTRLADFPGSHFLAI